MSVIMAAVGLRRTPCVYPSLYDPNIAIALCFYALWNPKGLVQLSTQYDPNIGIALCFYALWNPKGLVQLSMSAFWWE